MNLFQTRIINKVIMYLIRHTNQPLTSLGKSLPMFVCFFPPFPVLEEKPLETNMTYYILHVFFPSTHKSRSPQFAFSPCPGFNLLPDVYHLEPLKGCCCMCVRQQMLLHSPPWDAPAFIECRMWLPGQGRRAGIDKYPTRSSGVGVNKFVAASSEYRPKTKG